MALKALDGEGNGRISGIIAALDWVVANRDAYNIRVVNMSLGAGVFESYNTDPLTLAAKRAVDAGIVVVAAAGNMGKACNGQPQYGAIGGAGQRALGADRRRVEHEGHCRSQRRQDGARTARAARR